MKREFAAHVFRHNASEPVLVGRKIENVVPRQADDDRSHLDEYLAVIRQAVRESAMLYGWREAAGATAPVDAVTLSSVEFDRLRAWRSLGLYPCLKKYDSLNAEAIKAISELDEPYELDDVRVP